MILFGASTMGEAVYVLFKSTHNIIYFCDNDKNKWGGKFCGLEIIPPENLKAKELNNAKIIITSMYSKEIQNQLIEYGLNKERIQLVDFKTESILKKPYEENEYKSLKKMIDRFKKSKDYNLHIMPDSVYSKSFIEFVNLHFNKNEHKFIILTDFRAGLEYMDDIDSYENVEVIYYNKHAELKLYFYVKNSKKLFIHYLTDHICKFICNYEVWNETELNWIVWGGDLYQYINFQLYDEKTRKFITYKNDRNILFNKHYKKDTESYRYRIKTIKEINNIMTVCQEDYNLAKKNFETKAKMRPIFYPNPIDYENIQVNLNPKYNLKNKFEYIILLGNSGDPSNNHIDFLHKLKNFKNKKVCIICPLSYGNTEYIKCIIKIGRNLFGDNFIPLTDFLPQREYFNILHQVDAVIMGHRRQQAISNILALIYLRKKIYMKDLNPLSQFLNSINIVTFSCDLLEKSDWEEVISYSNNILSINRSRLIEYFSKKNCIKLWEANFEN